MFFTWRFSALFQKYDPLNIGHFDIYDNLSWRFAISFLVLLLQILETLHGTLAVVRPELLHGLRFPLPVGTSKPEVGYFAMKPTIFRYQILPWVIKKWFRVDWVTFRYSWNRKYWWKPEVIVNFNSLLHICVIYPVERFPNIIFPTCGRLTVRDWFFVKKSKFGFCILFGVFVTG